MELPAILGGTPVREDKIYYGRQWVTEEDIDAVRKVLEGPYITCGPKVTEAERRLESYTGAKHAVVVNSGTSALHCACIAAGIGEGDEVITADICSICKLCTLPRRNSCLCGRRSGDIQYRS